MPLFLPHEDPRNRSAIVNEFVRTAVIMMIENPDTCKTTIDAISYTLGLNEEFLDLWKSSNLSDKDWWRSRVAFKYKEWNGETKW